MKDKKVRNDIILGVAVIVAAAGVWLGSELLKEKGDFAVITVNGIETARYSLDTDAEIRLESENGGYNILVIKDGKVILYTSSNEDVRSVLDASTEQQREKNFVAIKEEVDIPIH